MFDLTTTYKKRRAALLGVFMLVLILLPIVFAGNPYLVNIFIVIFYTTTMSLAWNLLGGMTGQNSLGHAAYMGLGAYVACLFMTKSGMNPWVAIPIAMIFVGLIAGIVFYPCFLLRGPYFTLVSIAFGETIRQFMLNWEVTGQAMGNPHPYGESYFAQCRFHSKTPYYYIALIMVIGVYLIMKKINRSKLGFSLKTIREDEDVANAIGINPMKYKVIALVISAMIAAMVGCFYANYNRYIDCDLMLQSFSTEFILPAVIGGAAFVEGPLVGGIILLTLSEWLRNKFGGILPGINLILYAITLLCIIRFRPVGILGWYSKSRIKEWIDVKIFGKKAGEEV